MTQHTIEKINRLIEDAPDLTATQKQKLQEELGNFRREIENVAEHDQELAQQMADEARQHIHAQFGKRARSGDQQAFVNDLMLSFEVSHPRATNALQNIINLLAGIGI